MDLHNGALLCLGQGLTVKVASQHKHRCYCAMQAHPIVFLIFMVVVVRWRGGKSGPVA
jgi:hypothetical protein